MNLENYNKITNPYLIYEFSNCFNNKTIDEINGIIKIIENNIDTNQYNGKRENNDKRYYINKTNVNKHKNLKEVINYLLNKNTIKYLENLGNIKLDNTYLRLEVILDKESFWLEKHVDIPEKKISFLIFINDNNEPIENGTDIYNENLELVYTVPFINNLGYMFFPSHNTWHGLEKGKNIKYRKVILINYVTFETDWKL